MDPVEKQALLTIALLAAYADGAGSEAENAAIRRAAQAIGGTDPELADVYRRALFDKPAIETVAAALVSVETKRQAYEMAVGVCDADGAHSDAETAFLTRLAKALDIDATIASGMADAAAELAAAPLSSRDAAEAVVAAVPADGTDLDAAIIRYAVLNGALELLPQSLASLAIIPLQMKMVYRIGKAHGYELDRGHVADFLATVGVGLASQYLERFGRRLVGGLLGKLGGGLLAGLGSAGTGAAMSFATTFALGQVAKRYYAGGRTLDAAALRESFAAMLGEARALQARYAGAIEQQARSIDTGKLVALVRGG